MRDVYLELKAKGVEVLGVSFDSVEVNAEFVKKEKLPFRLLSDGARVLAVQVGAADSPSRLFARRISYIVGSNGSILKAYDEVDPASHGSQVLEDLAALERR